MRYRAGLAVAAAALLVGCTTQAAAGKAPTTTPPPAQVTTTTTPATTEPPPPPPCAPNIRACVSLSTRQAWLLTAGAVDYGPVPVSYGAPANPTPTGTWPVSWKDEVHTSSVYGDPMPFSVFFAPGGIAFHEGRLDEPSHGCVRLDMASARTFFTALTAGQLVQIVA
jgi:L,D-transpeptidase-like protein